MPLPRKLLAAVMIVSFQAAAFPQDPDAMHREILRLRSAGESKAAVAKIRELRKDLPDAYEANGYPYLAGRMAGSNGDPATEASFFLAAADGESAIRPYALWQLSKTMRKSGNLPAERLFLFEALIVGAGSAAEFAARTRLPESYYESGDQEAAALALTAPVKALAARTEPESGGNSAGKGEADLAREQLVLLGMANAGIGLAKEAQRLFAEVIATMPDPDQPDDHALSAVKWLDRIDSDGKERGAEGKAIGEDEHFLRAFVYQHNRSFDDARRHYRAIIEGFPESGLVPECLLRTGIGYAQQRDFHNAIESFERLQSEFPEHAFTEEALYRTAGAYANLNKPREASARYEKVIDEYPESERIASSYLNLIDLYRDAGEPGEALKWVEAMRLAVDDKRAEADALFARARIRISQKDWQKALGDLRSLRNSVGAKERTERNEIEFVYGRVLEELGRPADAADVYLGIGDGRSSYYGGRATERLKAIVGAADTSSVVRGRFEALRESATKKLTKESASAIKDSAARALRLAGSDSERAEMLSLLSKAYALQDEYRYPSETAFEFRGRTAVRRRPAAMTGTADNGFIARELLFLEIYDEGAAELELEMRGPSPKHSGSGSLSDSDEAMLAEFRRRGGSVAASVARAEGRLKLVPEDFVLELIPEKELVLLYPAPFQGPLLRYSYREKIDARFALSLMRQESRFDPAAKSSAAARGLMQFIPSTADGAAGKLELDSFAPDDLYDPDTALKIGAHHIAVLFRDFPGQPPAVAAAYNAGADRMIRWLRRSRSMDQDFYVPEIRFPQTKDYVEKVMANYRVYRHLYDNRLVSADAVAPAPR